MAYCKNCGQELPAGTKFCGSCGAPADGVVTDNVRNQTNEDINSGNEYVYSGVASAGSQEAIKPEKAGITRFFGTGLIIISILLFFFGDPPVLTVSVAAVILACSIICLVKGYRLKGFTITAIVLASLCLIFGVVQGVSDGWLVIPDEKATSGGSSAHKTDPRYAGVDPELKAFLDG